ncbi:unnamed protein product [Agarophyton chilense]|eukprot:gb/GEZJ01000767.1/.p1 GENE.gb/GEZJ01000767.1/~~gb/GEZJ01000767.1/.p1  ORF type:complete len:250 (+),score=44.67 gb/GEZJ01000767.1/:802-1551(+)
MMRNVSRALFRARRFAPQARAMFIQTQLTPNAHAVMFLPGRTVMPQGVGTADYPTLKSAANSPLARKLFAVSGVRSVFFGSDFVTVTKHDHLEWATLRPELFAVIMDFFTAADEHVIVPDAAATLHADTVITDQDSELVAMIKELLETRVKPAVAQDGGSIVFRAFDETTGVVQLELQGACSTCSSSSITLKSGVENMLRHYVPEVKSVHQVLAPHAHDLQKANMDALNNMQQKLSSSSPNSPTQRSEK